MTANLKPRSDRQHGRYRLLLKLGEGGTANVYLAVARGPSGFNKLVVLKLLRSNLAEDPEFRRMFLNEARLTARLNHQNIVQTYEVFEDPGTPVIVMEYLEGQTLSCIVARAQESTLFPLPMQLKVISEVLGGLQYSHDLVDYDGKPLHLVHRDMTPHNVFVTFDGQVKVLDFGIAKLNGSKVETKAGVIKGKVRYMPPEQLAGDPVDQRADLFAVGVILWEALTGQRMWKDMSEFDITSALLLGEIPSPRTIRPDVAEDLNRICMRALAPEKEDRYQTALEFQGDLDKVLHGYTSQVTAREIGQYVCGLFAESRAETRRVIEQELSRASSIPDDEDDGNWAAREASLRSIERANYATITPGDRTATGETLRRRRFGWMTRFRTPGAIAGIALVFGLVFWRLERGPGRAGQTPPSSPEQVAPPVPIAPVATTRPESVQHIALRAVAFPSESKLFLDGEQLTKNPYTGLLPRDGKEHVLRAEANGYLSETTRVTLDKDVEVTLRLKRQDVRKKPALTDAPKPAPAEPKSSEPQKPAVDCSRNYYVDEQGIKRFKLECM